MYISKIKFLLAFVIVLFSTLCAAGLFSQSLPIVKKFQLHLANSRAEVDFQVKEENQYAYILIFHKNKENSKKVLELMRHYEYGKEDTHGEPLYLSLEVFKVENDKVYLITQFGTESLPLYSTGNTFQKLVYQESLLPGIYKVVITSNKNMPAFKNIPVDFRVGLAHKPK